MAVEDGCGAEVLANELLASLTEGKSFGFPEVDLSSPNFQIPAVLPTVVNPDPLTNDDITTKKVDGDGTFDVIMSSMAAHLRGEFDKNRITGEQYTKAYIAMTQAALGGAIQFLMGKDASYWQSVQAQYQAQAAQLAVVDARVKLEISKVQLQTLRYEANIAEANYGLTKMKLATESVQYCSGKFQLEEMLPQQKLMLIAQRIAAEEQVEVQRAQTLNTRTDGTPIVGVIGKQRDLYSQQITSYQRDAEIKAAKLFSDAWVTMKTIDEGLLPPTGFTNASLDSILTAVKTNLGIGVTVAPPPADPEPTVVASTDNGDGTTTHEYSDGSFQTLPTVQP